MRLLAGLPDLQVRGTVSPRAIISNPGVLTSPTQESSAGRACSIDGIPDAALLEEERERFLRETQSPARLALKRAHPRMPQPAFANPFTYPIPKRRCRSLPRLYDQAQEAADA